MCKAINLLYKHKHILQHAQSTPPFSKSYTLALLRKIKHEILHPKLIF